MNAYSNRPLQLPAVCSLPHALTTNRQVLAIPVFQASLYYVLLPENHLRYFWPLIVVGCRTFIQTQILTRRNSRAAQTDSRTSSHRYRPFKKIIKRISWFICLEYGLFGLSEGDVEVYESRKNVLLNLS